MKRIQMLAFGPRSLLEVSKNHDTFGIKSVLALPSLEHQRILYWMQCDRGLAVEQPRLTLLERLPRVLRLLLHVDVPPRDNIRRHSNRLRLRVPPPKTQAQPSAQRQERFVRLVAEEARRLERKGILLVERVVM